MHVVVRRESVEAITDDSEQSHRWLLAFPLNKPSLFLASTLGMIQQILQYNET